jgi:ATP-dependent DNA ligase
MYNGKRTFDLLKFKKFYDAEFTVKDIEVGSKKMLVNQKMEETRCVTAIIIDFKGNNVGVGSGLSDEERIT